jgi:hypothetical protein
MGGQLEDRARQAITVAVTAVGRREPLRLGRVPHGHARAIALDVVEPAVAVVTTLLREIESGRYVAADVFLAKPSGISGWVCPMGIINLGPWDEAAFSQAKDTWKSSVTPVTNLHLGGHSGSAVERTKPRPGYRWVSGIAASSVTSVELTGAHNTRRVSPGVGGAFVAVVAGDLSEDMAVTAFTRKGLALPIDT